MLSKIKLLLVGLVLSTSVYTQSNTFVYELQNIETNDDIVGDIYVNDKPNFDFNYATIKFSNVLTIKKIEFCNELPNVVLEIKSMKLLTIVVNNQQLRQVYLSKRADGPILVTVIFSKNDLSDVELEIYNIKYEQYVALYYKSKINK